MPFILPRRHIFTKMRIMCATILLLFSEIPAVMPFFLVTKGAFSLPSTPHSPWLRIVDTIDDLAFLMRSNTFPGLVVLKNLDKDRSVVDKLSGLVQSTDEFDHSTKVCYLSKDVESLPRLLFPASWDERKDETSCLEENIIQLTNLMATSLTHPSDKLICRLNLMRQTRCPKWHEDYVDVRLIKSYYGAGTDYVDPSDLFIRSRNFLRAKLNGEDLSVPAQANSVHSASVGDVLILSGTMGPKRLAVVTGANKGIGLEIAKKLAQSGVHTILACRNIEYGGLALEHFRNLGLDAEFRVLDISDRHSISQFAHDMERDYEKIDILVNNAAIYFQQSDPTPFEEQTKATLRTNYFGTLWITQALLPLLRKASNPRIVNVSSEAGHLRILKSQALRDQFTSPDLTVDKLSTLVEKFEKAVEAGIHTAEGWPNSCYGTSKIAVIALTQVLARENPGMLVNACCPGYCATDMNSHQGTQSAEMGARTPVFLALLPENMDVTGKFFTNEQDITASW